MKIMLVISKILTVALVLGAIYLVFGWVESSNNEAIDMDLKIQGVGEAASTLSEYTHSFLDIEDSLFTITQYFDNSTTRSEAESAFEDVHYYLFSLNDALRSFVDEYEYFSLD